MINYIQLTWKLACMLRTYRTCNSMVEFSKYELNNKLLSGVTLLEITPSVTWTQPTYIYTHTHSCVCFAWKNKIWIFKAYLIWSNSKLSSHFSIFMIQTQFFLIKWWSPHNQNSYKNQEKQYPCPAEAQLQA